GLDAARRARARYHPHPTGHARHRGPVPESRSAREDRRRRGSDLRWASRVRPRRRLEGGGVPRLRLRLPERGGARGPAQGHARDRASPLDGGSRDVPRQALPRGRGRLRAETRAAPPSADLDRRGTAQGDAPHGHTARLQDSRTGLTAPAPALKRIVRTLMKSWQLPKRSYVPSTTNPWSRRLRPGARSSRSSRHSRLRSSSQSSSTFSWSRSP